MTPHPSWGNPSVTASRDNALRCIRSRVLYATGIQFNTGRNRKRFPLHKGAFIRR